MSTPDPIAEAALAAAVHKASHLPDRVLHPIPIETPTPERQKGPAEWAYERIILYIRNFESQLDSSQELVMGFTGNDVGILQIEGVGFFEPDLLTFYGRDENGLKTQLIQHLAQLSVMLRGVPKADAAEPPRRIGFQLNSGWVGGDSGDGSA